MRPASLAAGIRRLPACQEAVLALCRRGRLEEALRAVRVCDPRSVASCVYSSLLQLCTDLRAEREGRSLHELIAAAARSDLYLETKLIIFYGKIADPNSARRVFDGMPSRSVVSWSAMISGYARKGLAEEALEIFVLMQRAGSKANQFTYGSVLRACTEMLCMGRGQQIHGRIAKTRFAENPFVQSALVDLHSKCGLIGDARRLFDEIEHKDVTSWNSMIGGYAVQRREGFAFRLFKSMFSPDHFTFASVLKACSGIRCLAMIFQIHVFVLKSGFEHQELVVGSFIDAYVKCRNVDCARLLYDSLPDKDLISSTAMITSYARGNGGGGEDPLKLFALVNQTCAETDDVIVCTILSACANLLSVSMGRQIHGFTFKKLPGYDAAVGNALIDMYAKSGELEDARRVFEEMPLRNVISWTSMITACGRHGHGRAALTLLEKMESDGCTPNDVTFLAALSACGHAGLTDEGWRLFNSMVVEHGILPRSEHYACFVDLLARGGRLEEAYDFVRKMAAEPSSSLWGLCWEPAEFMATYLWGDRSRPSLSSGTRELGQLRRSLQYIRLGLPVGGCDEHEEADR
ncbi:unnamed protein product [Spirodela intermedia]|uniref:Uncharacterized protein n=1 Tax=Spirodela intermedia TaxID=51605 RepID=A0A7I8ISB4_SPIIN|nr:unnamed protein product [Spirodela intermedia]CAA6660676.1 unnamed protein product [Spirodela intermedia]